MSARDVGRGSGYDHAAHEGHQMGHGGHRGHHWMMLACCVPMVVIVVALVAAGVVGIGWVLLAVACVGMMALMMRGMDHSMGGGPDR